ncbi:uncharacterized protein [Solanum lycopersicum]|uniref:uncharacterized protein n=1 Tax=Solanum lycopersicum TaxID=4081 RepID=UPI003747CF3C
MEHVASILEGDWSSLSGMCFTEEAYFMALLLGNCSFPNELPINSNYYGVSSGYESNINMFGSSGGREHSSFFFPPPSHESHYSSNSRPILMRNDSSITTERGVMDTNNPIESNDLQLGRIHYEDKMDHSPTKSSKKRARLHGNVPKNKRSTKLQTDVMIGDIDGKNKAVLQRQNSMISCCSEDEYNVSLELT